MGILNSEQLLKDNNTRDPNSITSLTLTHRALSDVSCLNEFKNLERLDLSFNNLSSLEGLESCVNLKWLSVSQNKLQSLKGVQGLTKLTVLNAGKNSLKSMDEVSSLVSLCALILNDNKIASICRLHQLKELNTVVLSRNPISNIGEAFSKNKSIRKLSLSNCQLEGISSSLKSCTELRELRLTHNDIKALPMELAHNSKIRNLDLGNNSIAVWSDLKVLSSLIDLRNLNLQGNPIADKDKLAKKIKNLAPKLQVFNSRPIDRVENRVKCDTIVDKVDNSQTANHKFSVHKGEQKDDGKGYKSLSYQGATEIRHGQVDDDGLGVNEELKLKKRKKNVVSKLALVVDENSFSTEKKMNKKLMKESTESAVAKSEVPNVDSGVDKKSAKQSSELKMDITSNYQENRTLSKKDSKKSKVVKQDYISVIDDAQTPLADLFTNDSVENAGSKKMNDSKTIQDTNMTGSLVTFNKPSKKMKGRSRGLSALQQLSPAAEVGLGGASAWDD